MESNKVEARKAMDTAEKKLWKNDYVGAKKFVNKAQNLYPKLEGLRQVLMMIDVHISALKNGKGESDWYEILGVDSLADDKALKKQYKKLALLLHPDKNKFHGAEEAFKLVSDAWCLLSDKAKRKIYDLKRKSKQVKQKKKSWKKQKPPPPKSHEEPHFYENWDRNTKEDDDWYRKAKEEEKRRNYGNWDQNPEEEEDPRSYYHKSDSVDIFWTVCNRCNIYCKFERANLNKTLSCPNCSHDFVAREIIPEMINGRPVYGFSTPYRQKQQPSDTSSSTTSDSANRARERVIRGIEEIAAAFASGNKDLYG
ncbi:unnamed protein product [Arabis nemorensis]|uniref:J domain-containing protein n=1 Tax=Arabis nemorensis TaxID=586526 RepID=A0A565CFR1_9BRAS|nr:unnamed protein product [Arabis nemorensis]